MRLLGVLAFFVLLVTRAFSSGQTVGNPGDPVRLLIDQAKRDAGIIVMKVTEEDLYEIAGADPAEASRLKPVADWIVENRNALAADIITAPHFWIELETSACARTNLDESPSSAEPNPQHTRKTVYFSYAACREELMGQREAIQMVIHESTHHFGPRGEDEVFAYDVSVLIYNAWLKSGVGRTPRWESFGRLDILEERAFSTGAYIANSSLTEFNKRMITWGGCRREEESTFECGKFFGDGATYNHKTQEWQTLPEVPPTLVSNKQELLRAHATGAWTGNMPGFENRYLVWGGCSGSQGTCNQSFNSAFVFDANSKTWSYAAPKPESPSARIFNVSAWTGSELIVWGGVEKYAVQGRGLPVNTGAIWNPKTNTWRTMNLVGAPSPRRYASAVWTGPNADANLNNKLIVWGGCDVQVGYYCQTYFADGAVYDLATDKWITPLKKDPNGPSARALHTAVWNGSEMIVHGGQFKQFALTGGSSLNLKTGQWMPISDLMDKGRYAHSAVWADDRMIVWGGYSSLTDPISEAYEYYPRTQNSRSADKWTLIDVPENPMPRRGNLSFWTGNTFLIWGGLSKDDSFLNSGGVYFPRQN